MKSKVLLLTAFYLIVIPSLVIANENYNSKEFRDIIVQLDMQGHADHEFSTCTIQKVYYDEVVEMLDQGKSEKEILDYYVSEYGQAALRTPDTKGSGVIAWGMPAFGFLIGAIVVAFGIKRLTVKEPKVVETSPFLEKDYSETEQKILEQTIEEERRKLF
ncbi:cytochrome c-type biogenesis protein CcmH [Cytobacillus sp. FJAT-54145]|uniref:Cytochrome c-type biogenesis protein n=1 Tax=Cytobacillus spartinae TaxID=3299023 RepID=A0ABW6KKD9_9BACI